MPIDSQVQQLLNEINKLMHDLNHPPLSQTSPEDARYYSKQGRTLFSKVKITDVKKEDILIPSSNFEILTRIYSPNGTGPFPVLIYLHGGGWIMGSIDGDDDVCSYISKLCECVVVSVNYRLSPEHKYPVPLDDTMATINWVKSNIAFLNGNIERIAIGGESAGGNLAAAATIKAKDLGWPPLFCQLLICPVTHHSFDTDSYKNYKYNLSEEAMIRFWDWYLKSPNQGLEPYASPLLNKDFSSLPKALIVTAEFDPLRDEGEAYATLLEQAGVPVEKVRYTQLVHSFIHMTERSELAKKALYDILSRFKRILHGSSVHLNID
ncbi:alpha/beta hydrolase [Bacillus sp. FSL R5-0654]|uniref:alpha/beta hydrolase n=1 Tax=Bacillus TaxID=1386 RepID=UPI0028806D4D|nr:alpha/beta hydrolase [Bacillus sp. SG20001]WNF51266.1 alpha/beta hydrolase [Bacillus sp. SG20001]